MDVMPGYKQTEVGVIREDWDVVDYVSFGQVIDGDRGVHYPSSGELKEVGHCLFLNAGNVTKNGFRFAECQFISAEKDKKLNKGKIIRGDVVLTTRGTLGNLAYFNEEISFEHIRINSGMVILRNTSCEVDTAYQYLLLRSQIVAAQIERLSFGSAQPQLTVKGISTLKIPLPPTKDEQEAIAKALSDADALIESLGHLIAKKRQLKQGTMQELLIGKNRLPGFSGEWEVKKLSKIGEPYGGLTGKTKADFGGGNAQYIPFMNVISNVVINPSGFERVQVEKSELQNCAMQGDLFFNGSSETPEEVGLCSVLMCDVPILYLNSFCFGFRLASEADTNGLFLAYLFRSDIGRNLMFSLAQGSTRYNLSKTNFLKLEVLLPKPDEQAAIATILTDMDAEIAALETKLAKAGQIKQGMMQNLLTGRIRLV